jgi:hypothetical protein
LKVCISRLPKGTPDEFVKSLIMKCGKFKDWKRTMGANNEMNSFGIVDFYDV